MPSSAGVEFRQFGGDNATINVSGTASLESCLFADNIADNVAGHGVSYTSDPGSITWLKNVTFVNNTEPILVASNEGKILSADMEAGLRYFPYGTTRQLPVTVQQELTSQFLLFTDPWLLSVAKVRSYLL